MSRSSFFSRNSSSKDRDRSPLLPQHRNSVSLRDLSPRPSGSQITSRRASPSPPASFYRDAHAASSSRTDSKSYAQAQSLSPSPSRTKPRRKIQFSAPPPPIAASLLLPPQHARQGGLGDEGDLGPMVGSTTQHIARRGMGMDPLLVLERKERAIHQDLQFLLDAQSAGLGVHAFGAGDLESDAGSSTPTSKSMGAERRDSGSQGRSGPGRGIIPVRQPKRKTIGLKSARRGLLREIAELVDVKGEEMDILESEIRRREQVMLKVDAWQKRIQGVRDQLGAVNTGQNNEEDREISELENEEKAVGVEIRELEDRLATLRARQRYLGDRIKEGVNKREARLSSYRGALREAEAEVKEFLRRPPIATSVIMGDEEGFASLPPGRRTLDMAKEWWTREVEKLHARKEEVVREGDALEEGAALWNESINHVIKFEDDLRKQMSSQEVQGPEQLKGQILKMQAVIGKLQDAMESAEEKKWNLLICAIGAELEAFKQGQAILQHALDMAVGNTDGVDVESTEGNSDVPDDLNGTGGQVTRQESLESQESEDDGPNLAELFVDSRDPDDTSLA